jgi:hypothetical protein
VITHTTVPSVWFASPPDSGYSIDNLAPEPPTNLHWEGQTLLAWNEAPEADAAYYRVYGSESGEFSKATLLFQTTAIEQDVASAPHNVYHVTTSDESGNESPPSDISPPPLGAGDVSTEPRVFALSAAVPNPFGGRTALRVELPEPSTITLELFDAGGRRVRSLQRGELPAGRHLFELDARRDPLPPGVYFVRMRTPGAEIVRRIVRVDGE